MTFSIIGIDKINQVIGSAVASRWIGVGGCVQFFRAGVGFVNIQNHAYADVAHHILDQMESSDDLNSCIEGALQEDRSREARQCIVASLRTQTVLAYSGVKCSEFYSHVSGQNCVAAGNTLTGEGVLLNMVEAFETNEKKPLAERLLLSLEAAQAVGGDRRGQEAAALKVYDFDYPKQRLYPVDLRVDHHAEPLIELRKLYDAFRSIERIVTI